MPISTRKLGALVAVSLAMCVDATAAPELGLTGGTAAPGQEVAVTLKLSAGDQEYAGVNGRLLLPAGVRLVKVLSAGDVMPASFVSDFFQAQDSQEAGFLSYSGTQTTGTRTGGALLRLILQVASDAPQGADKPLTFVAGKSGLSNKDGSQSLAHQTVNATLTIQAPSTTTDDTDADGLRDAWETAFLGSLTASNGATDSDGDGLSDAVEEQLGTDPDSAAGDADGDGLPDAQDLRPYVWPGNVNGDAAVSVNDIVVIRLMILQAQSNPNLRVPDLADVNGDGRVTVNDVIELRRWILFEEHPDVIP